MGRLHKLKHLLLAIIFLAAIFFTRVVICPQRGDRYLYHITPYSTDTVTVLAVKGGRILVRLTTGEVDMVTRSDLSKIWIFQNRQRSGKRE